VCIGHSERERERERERVKCKPVSCVTPSCVQTAEAYCLDCTPYVHVTEVAAYTT
jgi:hypothetical protein